jgi:hypothetical protein
MYISEVFECLSPRIVHGANGNLPQSGETHNQPLLCTGKSFDNI